MRERLLQSLRFNLNDSKKWLELAKDKRNEYWLDDMSQYIYLVGKVYQTALILSVDYDEKGEEVKTARKMRYTMFDDISVIQKIHQEGKTHASID